MCLKRLFDVLVALVAVVLFLPIGVVVAFAIVMDSGRPVFFRQKRVGLHGRLFILYKFRTMTVVNGSENGSFDAGNKSRVTSVGQWLRRTKLDEWPQFLNVLKGDMSIVGPRPEVEKWTMVYPDRWQIVHRVKPGITDNASVLFRHEEELLASSPSPEIIYRDEILPLKLDHYIRYVNSNSLLSDIKIILKTALALVRR